MSHCQTYYMLVNRQDIVRNWSQGEVIGRRGESVKIFVITKFVLEVVAKRCSVKNVFLEISQNLLENTCARVSFLTKIQIY